MDARMGGVRGLQRKWAQGAVGGWVWLHGKWVRAQLMSELQGHFLDWAFVF